MSFDEAAWWNDCANTWHEEEKQLVYAERMGLRAEWGGAHPPTYDLLDRSVLDIGGGPVSILLKCRNRGECVVVDPADFPPWVFMRYTHCNIGFWHGPAEEIADEERRFDEAWIYNCLQHVLDPVKIIDQARTYADIIRVFEWVDVEPYEGHPQKLTRELLDDALGSAGYVVSLNERGCVGTAYYGVFRALA